MKHRNRLWPTRSWRGLFILWPCLACQIQLEPDDENAWWSTDEPSSTPSRNATRSGSGARASSDGQAEREAAPEPRHTATNSEAPRSPEPSEPSAGSVAAEPAPEGGEPERSASAGPPAGPLPSEYQSLIVLDPGLLNGPLGSNSNPDAPWSFRRQLSWLAGPGADSLEFTRAWLERWATDSAVGSESAPVEPRSRVHSMLVEPWFGAGAPPPAAAESEPAYGAEPAAPAPAPAAADWGDAPFRLIAIVNRVDLAADACGGEASGELRYVYTAIDPETQAALEATLIVEIPYPATRPAAEWALAWSKLEELAPGEEYTNALLALTAEVARDAEPLRARVRTNEVAFASPDALGWELREFHPSISDGQLALRQVPLELTPRADVDMGVLTDYVLEHDAEVRGGGAVLPLALQAGAAELQAANFSWQVLGVSQSLREAFSRQTCNGCHGGDSATLPFQHIAPGATPETAAQVSRLLYDPGAETDELWRRLLRLDELSTAECAPAAAGYASLR